MKKRLAGRGWRGLGMLLCMLAATVAWADEALWTQLKQGGYVVLIRHASTEFGIGDPPGFKLDDCSTQRNLSDTGRAEARRLGETFRSRGVPVSEVRSSQWCRCMETAKLAFGRAEPWPAINSVFADRSQEPAQRRAVLELASKVKPPRNLVLVTHNYNINALVGASPAKAEIVVARFDNGELKLVGRIAPP